MSVSESHFAFFPFQQKTKSTFRQTPYWHVNKTQLHSVIQFHSNHQGHRVRLEHLQIFSLWENWKRASHLNVASKNNWQSLVDLSLWQSWSPFEYCCACVQCVWNRTFLGTNKSWYSGFVSLPFVFIHQNGNFDLFFFDAVLHRLKVSANGVNEGNEHKQNTRTSHTYTCWECANRFRAVKSNVRRKSVCVCVSDADYWTIIYLCWCSFSRSNNKQQDELHAPDLMSQFFYGNGWIYKAMQTEV